MICSLVRVQIGEPTTTRMLNVCFWQHKAVIAFVPRLPDGKFWMPESIAALISRLFAILSRLSSTAPQSCRLRRVASPLPAHPLVLKVDDAAALTQKIRARLCSDCLHRAAKAWD